MLPEVFLTASHFCAGFTFTSRLYSKVELVYAHLHSEVREGPFSLLSPPRQWNVLGACFPPIKEMVGEGGEIGKEGMWDWRPGCEGKGLFWVDRKVGSKLRSFPVGGPQAVPVFQITEENSCPFQPTADKSEGACIRIGTAAPGRFSAETLLQLAHQHRVGSLFRRGVARGVFPEALSVAVPRAPSYSALWEVRRLLRDPTWVGDRHCVS